MALLNKVWREGEFVPAGAEPGLTVGRDWRNATEIQVVQEIARQRFPYPNAEQPDFATHINVPSRSMGVRGRGGAMLFPDIVVVNSHTTEAQMLAEVETVRDLNEAPDLAEKWSAFCAAGPFYLFVPMSHLDRARTLLKSAKIKPAGLRAWRRMVGLGYTDTVNV